jgi:hypothetical protein
VVVRQVTNAFATSLIVRDKRDGPAAELERTHAAAAADAEVDRPVGEQVDEQGASTVEGGGGAVGVSQEGVGRRSQYSYSAWRRVLGAFQLTIPVRPRQAVLVQQERALSTVRWIAESIPADSRWFPVFQRYVDVLGSRVTDFGGDPTQVVPSPTGDPHGPPHGDHDGDHDDDHDRDHDGHGGGHGGRHGDEDRIGHTGKVSGLIFDRFGDFEGFVLVTDEHERRYFSRESEVEALTGRAWRERLRITVFAERDEPWRAASIVIWEPPVAL